MAPGPVSDRAGELLAAVRSGRARTRSELVSLSGLARGTVARRLDLLLASGLLLGGDTAESTGGRPSEAFHVNPRAGSLLVADIGATRARVAACDLLGTIVAEDEALLDVARGPETVLDEIDRRWSVLTAGLGPDLPPLRGVGISVPGPVDQATGASVSPPIMTGWDRYPVRDVLAERYSCLAWVDKDVNAMALGEHRSVLPDERDLLYLKLGTGVGAGLILEGEVFRGAIGAAGDIGHIQLEGYEQRRCRCGMIGCVEAVAGGWALREQLAERDTDVDSTRAVVELVRGGHTDAVELVRAAGRVLGTAISYAVNLLNPSVVVIGGDLAHAQEQLLAGIRETVYRRSLPLATADLRFAASELDRRAGVVGLAHQVTDQLMAPDRVDRLLAAGAPLP